MIADCASFRTWVGAATPAAALARIHLVATPATGATRPFAIVDQGSETGFEKFAESGWIASGSLFLLFEANVTEAYSDSEADSFFEFWNKIGAICDEMTDLSGTGTYLNVTSITLEEGPFRSDAKAGENADYYQVILNIGWGV